MKKIMAAVFALCMLGGVTFAQNATSNASHKHAVKKEAKATKTHKHHVAKTEKTKKHAKHSKKAMHAKKGMHAKKTTSDHTNG